MNLKKKITIFVLVSLLFGGGLYLYNSKSKSNAAVPNSFMQNNMFYLDYDPNIPESKQYQISITTYDNPNRLMNDSYIQIYTPNGQLIKSQYFNGRNK